MKNMRMRVCQTSALVKVSAPYWALKRDVCSFIEENEAWLSQQVSSLSEFNKRQDAQVENCSVRLWGQLIDCEFKINPQSNAGEFSFDCAKKNLILYVSEPAREKVLNTLLVPFYKQQLHAVLTNKLDYFAAKMNVEVATVSLKSMKTRWGSCNPKLKKINLNTELAKYPVECLDYVLVHEMAHYYEMNHSARFWRIVDKAMPHWRAYHNQLNSRVY